MCKCASCQATHDYFTNPGNRDANDRLIWPGTTPVRLAKYHRAKASGTIPADPVYAAHVRACLTWSPARGAVREFTDAELRDRSVKVPKFKAPVGTEPDRRFPASTVLDVREYVKEFERLNALKST